MRTDADTAANPWTVSSGNYSSRFAAMGASAVHLAATRLAERLRALAAPHARLRARRRSSSPAAARACAATRTRSVSIRALAGRRALAPERPHGRGRRGARADGHLHAADRAAGRRRPRQLVGLLRLRGRRLRRRDRSRDGRARRARLRRRCTTPAACSTRCWPTGQIRGGLAHGLGAALLEEHRYDEDGNLMTGDVPRLPAADRDRAAARRLGAPRVAVAAHAARREGPRRGHDDERAGGDRERRRRRARRRRASSCRRRRSASGSCCEALAAAARAPALARRRRSRCWPSTATTPRCSRAGRASCRCSTSGSPRRRVLVDLNQVPALALIDVADGAVRVGALCPQRDLERHAAALAACPLLALALPYVGHVATRNRGTVGGSIAHADAAAELPLLLQTLGGRGRGHRAVGRAPRARRGVLRLAPDELPRARTRS